MLEKMLKLGLATTFAVLTALPAPAQVQVRVGVQLPGLEIRVGHRAPPRLLREHRPMSPGRGYMWIPGAWDWQNDDWAWIAGRWDRPNARRARWIRPRYMREGAAWRYEPGHWSNQRVVEGEDYRRWRDESRRNRDQGRHRGRDRRDRGDRRPQ